MRGSSERHTLPVLEFKSNLPVDATTFKKSGNSRNPKPQKSTCMIVHVQMRAAACIPVVILYSSSHSGLSASGPPATSNFIILGSWVDGLWPVKYTAGTWALRGFPGKHAYCRGVGCSNSQLRWAPLQACAPAFSPVRGGITQARYTGATVKPLPLYTVVTRVVTHVHFGWCDMINDWGVHKSVWGVVYNYKITPVHTGSILRAPSDHKVPQLTNFNLCGDSIAHLHCYTNWHTHILSIALGWSGFKGVDSCTVSRADRWPWQWGGAHIGNACPGATSEIIWAWLYT